MERIIKDYKLEAPDAQFLRDQARISNQRAENLMISHKSIDELRAENFELRMHIQHNCVNFQRLVEWIDNPNRKRAVTAFTEGNERQIAYRIESLIA